MRIHNLLMGAAAAALLVSASGARAATIDLSTLQLNGMASATANDLNLNQGTVRGASSGFLTSTFSSGDAFSGSFDISLVDIGSIGAATDPDGVPVLDGNGDPAGYGHQADGVAFLIQNDPNGASALGGGGGGIGADGIGNSVGIGFQSWDNNHATIFLGGETCDIPAGTFSNAYCGSGALGNFSLGDNLANHIHVTFGYSGGVLSFTALNSDTAQSTTQSRAVDLTTFGPQLYFGFTGATGLGYAAQDVSNFELTVRPAGPGVPEPATWALMLMGFGGLGYVIRRRRATMAFAA